jgi:glycosyltransferase involved in cell wall biosynthesis
MVLSIIIPAYNEEKYLPRILKKIKEVDIGKVKKQVIIVDDGSSDGTVKAVKEKFPEFQLIESGQNYGKAHAITLGLKAAIGDVVLIQDADLEYDPLDYPVLIEPFLNDNAKVVYGSRIMGNKNPKSSWLYYLGGRFISLVTNILYGSKITDEATGYKLFDRELLLDLNVTSKGFDFCPEVTAKILKRKIKIHEVPIHYYPRSREEGKKINAVKDGLIAVWTLAKYRFSKDA